MDWGLVRVDKAGRLSFRRELSLGPRRLYYAIMAGNFILRFAWAITYVPREIHHYSPVYSYLYNNFQTVMAATEIVRRMVWGFLRLEWEHIEKTGSAPLSLRRQRSLAREAAVQVRQKQEGGPAVGMGMDIDGDMEMQKMDVSTGLDHREAPVSIADEAGQCADGDYPESDGGLLEVEGELYFLLDWLPFDLDSVFPFFLFKGLKESVAYPRRRFHARVLEVCFLTAVVVFVMSVSAGTKMHSAGYI